MEHVKPVRDARRMCSVHPTKFAQSALGLCRACERELEADTRNNFERETEQVMRRRPRLISRSYIPIDPATLPVRVYYGIEYVVLWSGSNNGAQSLGIPLAAQRGDPRYQPGHGGSL